MRNDEESQKSLVPATLDEKEMTNTFKICKIQEVKTAILFPNLVGCHGK